MPLAAPSVGAIHDEERQLVISGAMLLEQVLTPSLDVFEAVLDLDKPSDDTLELVYTNLVDVGAMKVTAAWPRLPRQERLDRIRAAGGVLRQQRLRLN